MPLTSKPYVSWSKCLWECLTHKFSYIINRNRFSKIHNHPFPSGVIIVGLYRSKNCSVQRLHFVTGMGMKRYHKNTIMLTKINNIEFTWLSWLSKSKITGFSIVGFTWFLKCSKYSKNNISFDHPDGLVAPIVPIGQLFSIWVSKLTLGNIIIVGIWFPIAFIEAIQITFWPRSPLVIWPHCFVPLGPIIFGGTWTVVNLVSSQFQIFSSVKFPRDNEFFIIFKKRRYVCLIKWCWSGQTYRVINLGIF